MTAKISYTFTAPDGTTYENFERCWNYVRRHWYPNLLIFDEKGKITWRVTHAKHAIINNEEELDFFATGLHYKDNNIMVNSKLRTVGPKTWISFYTKGPFIKYDWFNKNF